MGALKEPEETHHSRIKEEGKEPGLFALKPGKTNLKYVGGWGGGGETIIKQSVRGTREKIRRFNKGR